MARVSRMLGVQGSLFNVLFSFISEEDNSTSFKEVSAEMHTGYPLAIEIQPNYKKEKLSLRIVYDDTYIPDRQAEVLMQQLDAALSDAKEPLPLDSYSLENLGAADHHIETFVKLFQEQVSKQANAAAFAYAESMDQEVSTITFKELDEASDKVAANLVHASGDVVGVHLRQCREIYAVLIGLWKAGKVSGKPLMGGSRNLCETLIDMMFSSQTYLPLDPALPYERLEHIVNVANPCLITSKAENVESAQKLGQKVVELSELFKPATMKGNEPLRRDIDIDGAAYIMFTSGSTGKPKGVQISHRALGAAIFSWRKILPHQPGQSRLLQLASPGFDVFLIEVCMPLALGFSFGSAPKDVLLDDLETTFHKLALTMADLPAALATTVEPSRLPKLEWLMSGGDQIDQRVLGQWGPTGLVNAWGPTEATIGNTLGFVTADASRSWIGKCYPTSSIFVMDPESHTILPRGCVGELAVGGPQVADGYVGNARLTAERFIELTLPSSEKRIRVYCTGDKGRILVDGGVECLGRIEGDGQVKINSQRVELKEIELAISKNSDVADAAVLYTEHPQLPSKQLVSFIVLKGSVSQQARESDAASRFRCDGEAGAIVRAICSHLMETLPSYMIPQSNLVMVDKSIPLTPNDKKDIRGLQRLFQALSPKILRSLAFTSRNVSASDIQTPWSETEKRLRSLVALFVRAPEEEISRTVSLHRLGIDSISGIRLVRLLRENGFPDLMVRSVLKSPTVAKLAQTLESREAKGQRPRFSLEKWQRDYADVIDASALRLSAADQVVAMPCTPLQEGLLLEGIASEGSLYVHHHIFDVPSNRCDSVVAAFATAVRRHDILRTSFHMAGGDLIQVIHSKAPLEVQEITTEANEIDDKLVSIMKLRAFGSEEELAMPPLRVVVLKNSSGTVVIDLVLHHALYDGETLSLLFKEVQEIVKVGEQSLGDPASFQRILPSLMPSQEASDYWANQLEARRDMTFVRKEHVAGADPAQLLDHKLSTSSSQLKAFATKNDVSIHIASLFAFSKLLALLSGQRDVVFAQLFGLRDAAEGAERVLGPALNTVITPVTIEKEESVTAALQRLQKENDEARDYRAASLADVQRKIALRRKAGPQHIDALFDFQRTEAEAGDDQDETTLLRPRDVDMTSREQGSQYALNIEFVQAGEKLSLIATARTDAFGLEDLQRALTDLDKILEHMLKDSGERATSMPDGLSDLGTFADLSGKGGPPPRTSGTGTVNGGLQNQARNRKLTRMEVSIAETIAKMLGLEVKDLDPETDFSHFGLDSIASIRLASNLRKADFKVGVVDILQSKTIAVLASRLDARMGSGKPNGVAHSSTSAEDGSLREAASRTLAVDKADIEAISPLLPGQVFELAAAAHSGEVNQGIFTFMCRPLAKGSIDLRAFCSAWNHLRARHPSLRTAFALLETKSDEDRVFQVILTEKASKDDNALQEISMHSSTTAELISSLDAQHMQRLLPVDSTLRTPSCACRVIRSSDGDIVVLRMHHALYDAWSLSILLQELSQVYTGCAEKKLSSSSRHIDYSLFVALEHKHHAKEAEQYWVERLPHTSPSIVGDVQRRSSEERSFIFFRNALQGTSSLERAASKTGDTLPSLVLAAWAITLRRLVHAQNPDRTVTFGTYQVGRSSAFDSIETLASNCMNIVPVLADVGDATDADGAVVRHLGRAIKKQLDERAHLDATTSLVDILRWTKHDEAPWNTYVNLLWGSQTTAQGAVDEPLFVPMSEAMTQDHLAGPSSKQTSDGTAINGHTSWTEAFPNLHTDVNVDVQRDRDHDAVHIGFQWRGTIWSSDKVRAIVDGMCSLIKSACE